MAWTWEYLDEEGRTVDVEQALPERFGSRSDAESWLGTSWRDLREQGVAEVVLVEDGNEVYHMGLNES
jgi:hypothetical protein